MATNHRHAPFRGWRTPYETPFVERLRREEILAGEFPDARTTAATTSFGAAYVMLHEHFPESEWAQKTPYWYGRLE